jgi:8-oxo-dGTP pyrophosphatase MutT (NUDIX family)
VISQGVHMNGRVRRPNGLHLWVGWRSKDKSVAPGKLDNLVAGGVPAGLSPMQTLLKEAAEEASMPPELAARARQVSRVSYRMADGPGIRRDVLHCFDLDVPEDFTPVPADDEVERFELWPVERVLRTVTETSDVKFNVNLVLIDLFLREGLIDPRSDEGKRLRAGLDPGP